MRYYFCLYPHCLIRRNNNTVIAYNTISHNYVISKEGIVLNAFEGNTNCVDISIDMRACDFFSKCVEYNIGYIMEGNHMPFVTVPTLKVVTSIEKEKKALGYLSFPHSSQMLKQVTIFTTNTLDKRYPHSYYDIIEYPHYSETNVNICDYIEKIIGFCSLKTIILSGDLDFFVVEKVLKRVNNLSMPLVIKTYADFYNEIRVNEIIENNPNARFEFLFDKSLDIEILKAIQCNCYYNEQVFLNVLVEDIKTFNDILRHETIDFIITPMCYEGANSEKLKEELYITKEDILNRQIGMKDILIGEHVNTSCFGSIVIKTNGDVMCRNHILGNLGSFDLAYLINEWVSNTNKCSWFNTRRLKSECLECIYNFLCSPISIYEEMGIIDNACGNNVNRS